MSDLIVGIAIGIVVAVFIGAPLAALGRLAARMQDKGRRCAYRRPHPAVVLALGLLGRPRAAEPPAPATWERIRAGMRPAPRRVDTSRTLAEMVGPIVTEAEVAEEFERRPLAAKPWALTDDDIREQWERARVLSPFLLPLRPCCPTTAEEPHRTGCQAADVPMSPDPEVKPFIGWQVPDDWRLPGGRGLMFVRSNKQPWDTTSFEPVHVPDEPGPAWGDPGDELGPQVPLARPYAPPPVYGEACQLDVAEAERLAREMIA